MVEIIGILAAAPDGAIGLNGGLPWHYPDETRHFLDTTRGHILLMGRKTYEASPRELYDTRKPWVLTRQPRLDGLDDHALLHGLDEVRQRLASLAEPRIFMIGGADTAHQCLQNRLVSSFVLTRIHKAYAGDVHLDLSMLQGWPETVLARHQDYTVVRLERPPEKERQP